MKRFFNKTTIKLIAAAVVGFICGCFVDSAVFHINNVFCGVIEATVLSLVVYAFAIKDKNGK